MPTRLIIFLRTGYFPPILRIDTDTLGQEGLIAEVVENLRPAVFYFRKNFRISSKCHGRSGFFGFSDRFDIISRLTAIILLLPDLPLPFDRHPGHDRQSIHDRYTDSVKTAGNLVSVTIEFSSRMKHGQYRFQGRLLGLFMNVYRDTPTVIGNLHPVIGQQAHIDFGAVSRHGLIDRIVHYFPDEMMQSFGGSASDIHTRTLPHRIKSLENLNRFRAITGTSLLVCHKKII